MADFTPVKLQELKNLNNIIWIPNKRVDDPIFRRGSNFSPSNLNAKQLWFAKEIVNNIKSIAQLEGTPVMLVANETGAPITPRPMRGSIVRIDGAEMGVDRCRIVIMLATGDIYVAQFFQIEPIKSGITDVQRESPEKIINQVKIEQDLALIGLIDRMKRKKNANYDLLKNTTRDLEARIKDYQHQIEYYTNELKKNESALKGMTEVNVGKGDIFAFLKEIRANKNVEEAYISTKQNLIVITKPLQAIDKDKYKPIEDEKMNWGRFAFRIKLDGSMNIGAVNLDYHASDHFHSNISGTGICMGENETQFRKLSADMNFYGLVDLLIEFFSIYPHDGGSPYIDPYEWMEEKTKIRPRDTHLNNWISEVLEPMLIGRKLY